MVKKTKVNEVVGNPDYVWDDFNSDKERIKATSRANKNKTILEGFFGKKVPKELKASAETINAIATLEVGGYYEGTVTSFGKNFMNIYVPAEKNEIVVKDNFNDCLDAIGNYLLTHDNKLRFHVREQRDGKFYVSVLEAYYKDFKDQIMQAVNDDAAVQVHIESLIKAGYLATIPIWTINDLTGKNYTSAVFIPGSHIVLNIEKDFERWIGEDVYIVPQKFMKFKRPGAPVEDSIVGSRKRVLEIVGMKNMYEIYSRWLLAQDERVNYVPETFDGIVTGIINSNKKTGIFVEIPDKNITGLVNVDPSELLNYIPGDNIRVRVADFDIPENKEPFEVNRKMSTIKKCNVKIVFEVA